MIFACIVSVSVAQCTGNITNDTMRVRLAWKVLNGNTVSFQLFAPGTKKQFTMLVFAKTNETTTLSNELVSKNNVIYIWLYSGTFNKGQSQKRTTS